ncbi:hypothetical protein BKA56DRAFT_642534 [Ilyonectria sp. MPI-CAGE-AT-0026]|nr:hypothetical protein BKA56DRAFT_642534 [Ilyonectria sp. MPI-CAGE-AT-0026]
MSLYAESHVNPEGPRDARPTALQIIADEGLEGKLGDKAAGARLFLTARDIKKAGTALEGIFDQGRDTLIEMDNGSLESVRKAAAKILESSRAPIRYNHLSHFLLFKLLQPTFLSRSTSAFQSRVIIVASSGHRLANEIERRFGGQGLHAFSLNPGTISTPLARHVDAAMFAQIPGLDEQTKSVKQGAATTVLAAVSKEWEGRGEKYLENCAETQPGEDDHNPLGVGYVPHTYDVAKAKRLWADSLKMTGLPEEADKEL